MELQTEIAIQDLSSETFTPIGDVIEIRGAESISINDGFALS
ncbi:MAG: hypothetical protein ACR2PB_07065 [Desulfocapsaceae bacterium]